LADRWGRTRLDLGLNVNTAWLGETPDYTAYGARDSSYATLRIEASRITKLGSWGQLSVRGTAQFANQDIPAIDHFYGSGMAGVRGYDENSYHGADAWFASVEHQGPRISLPKKCSLQPVVFVDAAGFPGGASDDNIAGAGVGIRLRAGEGFTLRVTRPGRSATGRPRTSRGWCISRSVNVGRVSREWNKRRQISSAIPPPSRVRMSSVIRGRSFWREV